METASVDRALAINTIKQELAQKAEQNEQLVPLLSLVEAAQSPDVDLTQEVELALRQIQHDNAERESKMPHMAPAPTLTYPFWDIPEFADEIGRASGWKADNFHNWATTVNFKPGYTLVVKSVKAVCAVVKWAAKKNLKVRVAGFRHTWTNLYGGDGDVIIMFLPVDSLTTLPYEAPPPSFKTELCGIEIVPMVADRMPAGGHAFCKIMAGTTNAQFREWCFDNKTWCLPFNVIMLEVTFGGTNAPICHGSSFSSSTLSDLVVEVSYVDVNGSLQTINDPQELRAASGCFGLLGVVVSLTLQLDQMSVAKMVPVKIPLVLAIPPPKNYVLPYEVQDMVRQQGITEVHLAKAQQAFINRCKNDYYLEWFWFPYQEHVWVNTWQKFAKTSGDSNLRSYPSGWINGVKSQELQEAAAEYITNSWPWSLLSGRLQAATFGSASMVALPNIQKEEDAIKTYTSDALHFRRGIQNFRCWDTEWEIPIPAGPDGDRDYETIQRAWWDGISAMYSRNDAPVRVALEMRLTGSSNVILAPQRGNTHGTISIEVLTTVKTPQEDWDSFCRLVADKWTSYPDLPGAVPRPHWAKQWQNLKTIRGKPIERYLKEDAYKEAFVEFREELRRIVEKRGGTLEGTRERFGNETLERLIFE